MTRAPATHACSGEEKLEVGLKKGPWTPDEDHKLVAYIQKHGHGSWRSLPVNAGLQRCGKSCRLRWTNYLRPDIKRGRFSQDEDQMIVHLHAILGNRWSAIASHLPRRTDNEIKNYWNTHLKKRLLQMGIDPVTHKSTASEELVLDSIIPGLRQVLSSNLRHMSQWDCARAEAEARLSLSRQCSLSGSGCSSLDFQGPSQTTPPRGSSTSFMSSWKEQVAETLRPSFGFVELDKVPVHPVNLQTFLQDWELSLQAGPLQGSSHVKRTFDSGTSLPSSTSTSTTSAMRHSASSCEFFTPPARNSATPLFSLAADSQGSSSSSFSGMCKSGTTMTTPRQSFSPTSTLHAPDYDSTYTNSPCVSSTEASCNFDGLLTSQTTTSSFPLLNFQDQLGSTFWCRQQVAMVDALQQPESASYFLPNNIRIPHFDSLC